MWAVFLVNTNTYLTLYLTNELEPLFQDVRIYVWKKMLEKIILTIFSM